MFLIQVAIFEPEDQAFAGHIGIHHGQLRKG